MWRRLVAAAGLADAAVHGAPLEDKVASRAGDDGRVAAPRSPTRAALTAALDAAGIAWGDVRDANDLLDSPTLRHGRVVAQVADHAGGTRGVIRMPYRFSVSSSGVRGPAPRRGDHNREVLADWLGATDSEIDDLVAAGTLQTG